MGRLTAAERRALPDSAFAGPGRTYPVEDAGHAEAAEARVGEFGSPALKKRVDAKARGVLKRGAPAPERRKRNRNRHR